MNKRIVKARIIAIAFIVWLIGTIIFMLSGCERPAVRVEKQVLLNPVVIMDKHASPRTPTFIEYKLQIYDGENTYWYSCGEEFYLSVNPGDTLCDKVLMVEKFYYEEKM